MTFTTISNTPESNHFLDLPSEIRVRIYRHLFAIQSIRISIRSHKSWSNNRITHTFRLFGPNEDKPYILLACKTAYSEAWLPFLQAVVLHYGVYDTAHSNLKSSPQQIDSAGTETSEESNGTLEIPVWVMHCVRGSNINLSLDQDIPVIESVYDNIQISHLLWFRHELARLLPKLRSLTIRRNWDTSLPNSGKHSGIAKDIEIELIHPDVEIGFIPHDKITGTQTSNRSWFDPFNRQFEPHKFDMAITSLTDQHMHNLATTQIKTYRLIDSQDRNAMSWDKTRKAIADQIIAPPPAQGKSTYTDSNGTIVTNHPAPSLSVKIKPRPLPSTSLSRRNDNPYLLSMPRSSRGYSVTMHFTMNIYITCTCDINDLSVYVDREDPIVPFSSCIIEDKAAGRGYSVRFYPELSERIAWDGQSQKIPVRKLDVWYDWDTGDLIDLHIHRMTRSITG